MWASLGVTSAVWVARRHYPDGVFGCTSRSPLQRNDAVWRVHDCRMVHGALDGRVTSAAGPQNEALQLTRSAFTSVTAALAAERRCSADGVHRGLGALVTAVCSGERPTTLTASTAADRADRARLRGGLTDNGRFSSAPRLRQAAAVGHHLWRTSDDLNESAGPRASFNGVTPHTRLAGTRFLQL
jgi:hypothetical protein